MKSSSKTKRGSAFQYRDNDADAARSAAAGGGDFDSVFKKQVHTFRPGEGKHRIRILPRTWDDDSGPRHWGFEIFVHYGVGPDNSAYLCINKMKGERCPICEERQRLSRAGDEEAAKELRPSKAIAVWVIDRKNPSEGPLMWRMPATKVHNEIIARCDDSDTGAMLRVDHPDKGYDIAFKKVGSKRNTDYIGIDIAREKSPISSDPEQQDEWLDFIAKNPIPDVLQYYDTEYLERVFGGASPSSGDDDDDDEEEEKPRRGAKPASHDDDDDEKPSRRGSHSKDDDDDEDDDEDLDRPNGSRRGDDDDDEDDDENEKPARSRRGSHSKDDDDEDDDDEEESEDDSDDSDDDDDEDDKSDDEDEDDGAKKRSKLRDSVSKGLKARNRR